MFQRIRYRIHSKMPSHDGRTAEMAVTIDSASKTLTLNLPRRNSISNDVFMFCIPVVYRCISKIDQLILIQN